MPKSFRLGWSILPRREHRRGLLGVSWTWTIIPAPRKHSANVAIQQFSMTKNDDSQEVGIPVAVVVANDEGHYTSAPSTAPAPQVYFHEQHTHHAEESTKRRGLFATAMSTAGVSFALILAHGCGMIFAFCSLICLTSVGFGMLPAACVGVVILLALKGLLRPIAKMDEVLYAQRKAIYSTLLE
ncbi:unnamed protein product [Aphanomyces euteiches]|nr:hypothetical protein AeRB84_016305 [Aphanomyces euteiches]